MPKVNVEKFVRDAYEEKARELTRKHPGVWFSFEQLAVPAMMQLLQMAFDRIEELELEALARRDES